jgi:hypothetical protein
MVTLEKNGSTWAQAPVVEAQEARCPLCESATRVPLFEMADRDGIQVAIQQCFTCSVLVPGYEGPRSSEEATAAQVAFHDNYWMSEQADDMAHLVRDCAGIVDHFAPWLGSPPALVAEIGAGRGGLMAALKTRGYSVVGCEPSRHLCEVAYGHTDVTREELRVESVDSFLSRPEWAARAPRAFILWHVLEHLAEPWDTLRRIGTLCASGDCVLGQLPLLRSDYLYPEHYFFVTEVALAGLARSSGFDVAAIEYDGAAAFLSFVFRRHGGPVPPNAWVQVAEAADRSDAVLLREENRRLREIAYAEGRLVRDRERAYVALERLLHERDATVAAQAALLEERMNGLNEQGSMIRERDEALAAMRGSIAECRARGDALDVEVDAARRCARDLEARGAELTATLEAQRTELTVAASQLALLRDRLAESDVHRDRLLEALVDRDLALSASRAQEARQSMRLEALERGMERQAGASRDLTARLDAAEVSVRTARTDLAQKEQQVYDLSKALADRTAEVRALRDAAQQFVDGLVREDRRPGGPPHRGSLLGDLSLHLSYRMLQRWQGIRGLHVPLVAPSIGERLTHHIAERLPSAVASRINGNELHASTRQVIEWIKGPLKGTLERVRAAARSRR